MLVPASHKWVLVDKFSLSVLPRKNSGQISVKKCRPISTYATPPEQAAAGTVRCHPDFFFVRALSSQGFIMGAGSLLSIVPRGVSFSPAQFYPWRKRCSTPTMKSGTPLARHSTSLSIRIPQTVSSRDSRSSSDKKGIFEYDRLSRYKKKSHSHFEVLTILFLSLLPFILFVFTH